MAKKKPSKKKKTEGPEWNVEKHMAFRQWLGVLDYRYRGGYKRWCADRNLIPDYETGYYEYLCLMSGVEYE